MDNSEKLELILAFDVQYTLSKIEEYYSDKFYIGEFEIYSKTFLSYEDFKLIKSIVESDKEISEARWEIKKYPNALKTILDKRKKNVFDLIDQKWFDSWISSESLLPLTFGQSVVMGIGQFLSNIKIYQWLNNYDKQPTPSVSEPQTIEPNPSVSEPKKISKQSEIKNGDAFSAKTKIEILRQLGVFDSEIMKAIDSNKKQRNKLLSMLLGGDNADNIDKYITETKKDKKMSYQEFKTKFIK